MIEVLAFADNAEKGDGEIVEAMRGESFVSCQWHPELDWGSVGISRQMFLFFKEMVDD